MEERVEQGHAVLSSPGRRMTVVLALLKQAGSVTVNLGEPCRPYCFSYYF